MLYNLMFYIILASALKDVMRMIATRKNIRLEDGEVESAVGGSSSGSTVEEQRAAAAAVASGSKTSRSRGLGMGASYDWALLHAQNMSIGIFLFDALLFVVCGEL